MIMDMSLNSTQTDYAVKIMFTNLTVSIDDTTIIMSGTMSSEGIISSQSLVLNMVLVDNTKSEQVKLENFEVTIVEAKIFDSSGYM